MFMNQLVYWRYQRILVSEPTLEIRSTSEPQKCGMALTGAAQLLWFCCFGEEGGEVIVDSSQAWNPSALSRPPEEQAWNVFCHAHWALTNKLRIQPWWVNLLSLTLSQDFQNTYDDNVLYEMLKPLPQAKPCCLLFWLSPGQTAASVPVEITFSWALLVLFYFLLLSWFVLPFLMWASSPCWKHSVCLLYT